MTESISDLARLIAKIEIEEVALLGASVKRSIRSADETEARIQLNKRASLLERSDDGRFYVQAEIEFSIEASGSEQPAVSIHTAFELTYRHPSDLEVTSQVLQEFAEINGVFNVWPYWREFIQSTMARMNLPVITIPVFRLAPPSDVPTKRDVSAQASE